MPWYSLVTSLVPFIVERLALPSRRVSVVTVCVFSTDVDSFPTNRVTKDWTPVIVWWHAKDTHPSRTEPARTVCVRYGCVDSSKDDEALSAPEEKEMHQIARKNNIVPTLHKDRGVISCVQTLHSSTVSDISRLS